MAKINWRVPPDPNPPGGFDKMYMTVFVHHEIEDTVRDLMQEIEFYKHLQRESAVPSVRKDCKRKIKENRDKLGRYVVDGLILIQQAT